MFEIFGGSKENGHYKHIYFNIWSLVGKTGEQMWPFWKKCVTGIGFELVAVFQDVCSQLLLQCYVFLLAALRSYSLEL